ncbi:MAG: hypothetical protein L3J14_00205 [Flavobacteriaceae bacterium]|nr:hypothetical protein [Flavobacteriaceae bacterium]
MKKLVLVLAIVFAAGFTMTSCKSEKKEEKKEVATAVYQCPMDCEDGKSYTEPGQCPVCKMDLKEKKVSMEDNHEGHDH